MPILAAVDDFLFRSKIRATAKHVNAEIVFAQTPDEILAQARKSETSAAARRASTYQLRAASQCSSSWATLPSC